MKLANEDYVCPVCGHKENPYKVYWTVKSHHYYLDGCPADKNPTDDFYMCPECHYLSLGLLSPVSEEIKNLVHSPEYQNNLDNRLKLIEMLDKVNGLYPNVLYWNDRSRKDCLNRYIEKLDKDSENSCPSFMDYIRYVDLLREAGRFDDAEKEINILLGIEKMKKFAGVYKKALTEKELIEKKDSAPYLLGDQ